MNCSVCNKNPAVAKCSLCGKVICKTCGVLCPSCQKPICRTHLVRLSDGKIACRLCAVPKQQLSPPKTTETQKVPPSAAIPEKKEEKVSLSFEDLMSEMGDIRIKVSDTSDKETKTDEKKGWIGDVEEITEKGTVDNPFSASAEHQEKAEPAPAGYKHLKRKPSDDPNEFRILTASAPKPTPMWVSGLISAILAVILSIPLVKNSQSPFFPSFFSYSVILLAGGSAFWNGYGLLWTEDTAFNRLMCIPGIILGLIAIGIGVFFGLK